MTRSECFCESDVLMFIGRFSTDGNKYRPEVIEAFTTGCCYWFAFILMTRFKDAGAKIVVNCVLNHFGTEICGRVYDITGDVTDIGGWQYWDEFDDVLEKERIIGYCVMF